MAIADLVPLDVTPTAQLERSRRPRFKPARMYRALQRKLKDGTEERDAICRAVIFAASDPESRWFMDAVELVLRGDPDLRKLLKEDGSAALAASAPRIVIVGPESAVTQAPATACIDVTAQYTSASATEDRLSEASATTGDAQGRNAQCEESVPLDVVVELRATVQAQSAQIAALSAMVERLCAASAGRSPGEATINAPLPRGT